MGDAGTVVAAAVLVGKAAEVGPGAGTVGERAGVTPGTEAGSVGDGVDVGRGKGRVPRGVTWAATRQEMPSAGPAAGPAWTMPWLVVPKRRSHANTTNTTSPQISCLFVIGCRLTLRFH